MGAARPRARRARPAARPHRPRRPRPRRRPHRRGPPARPLPRRRPRWATGCSSIPAVTRPTVRGRRPAPPHRPGARRRRRGAPRPRCSPPTSTPCSSPSRCEAGGARRSRGAPARPGLGERGDAGGRADQDRPARRGSPTPSPSSRLAAPGVEVLPVSAVTGDGLDEVAAAARGTTVLVGPSGAGKSTLANALLGEEALAVGEVRASDGKGRHTTAHRELVPLRRGRRPRRHAGPAGRRPHRRRRGHRPGVHRRRRARRRAAGSPTARTTASPGARCGPRSSAR